MIEYELIVQLSDVGMHKMIDSSGKRKISPKKLPHHAYHVCSVTNCTSTPFAQTQIIDVSSN